MTVMEQLFYVEPGRVEWREHPRPHLEHGEDAVVRPLAVATCDLDTGLIAGRAPFPGPFPLGHEGVGEVIEVGEDVTDFRVGQLVIIPFQVSCGTCGRCRRGRTASCERVPFGSMYGLEPFGGPWGGFLSDAVRVPWADHMLVGLPEGVDAVSVASLSDNICDGWRTVAPFIDDPSDEAVLVVGGESPSVQYYSIAIAKALGVERVDYISLPGVAANFAHKAQRIGAKVIDRADAVEAGGYSVVVCGSATVDSLDLALKATEPDGTCVVNTIFFQDRVGVPLFAMYTHGVRLVTGRVNARNVLPDALQLVVDDRFSPADITDAVVPWTEAAAALAERPEKLVIHR